MALVTSNHRLPSKPGFPRFLIALFLVKSKPANISIQGASIEVQMLNFTNVIIEYVLSLRSYIKEGCRLEGATTFQAYVDTSAFWRDAYKKSEEAQVELRAKIFESERRQDAQTIIEDTSPGKRKRLEIQDGGVENGNSPKKPKTITTDRKFLTEMMPFQTSLADMRSTLLGQHSKS